MKKIDWKRKFTSRKFLMAVTAVITALLYAFGFSHIEVEKIVGVVMAMLVVCAYIIGEGIADAGNAGGTADTLFIPQEYMKFLLEELMGKEKQ